MIMSLLLVLLDLCAYCVCALVGAATLGPCANTYEGGGLKGLGE